MNKLQQFIASKPCGFVTKDDMPELIALDRFCPLLVRCGGCRFTCAAQYLEHLMKCIEAGGDYVRDVSFPDGSLEEASDWVPEEAMKSQYRAKVTKAAGLLGVVPDKRKHIPPFNEADCGGVFDGFTVSSDADPGL